MKEEEKGMKGGGKEEALDPARGREKGNDEQLAECRKQAEENLAGWKRAMADYQNREKDLAREKEELAAYSSVRTVLSILPALDHLRAAIAQIPAEHRKSEWVAGVGLVVREFDTALRSLGVQLIETVGKAFDPSLHESVGDEESESAAGSVVREVQPGYTMGGKVIRPSKVIIAK
ncbi:nucleotide exchange factor GrpE [Candidatus Uhrbacteria bacterium RIFCSPHIGHO2_02_FULL_57_19]|uniref:Protein GrpE n=2 Tax=Candidatus Uhriibacteriota TaxID=1752732 RepID=A0A1F7U3D5_9BACT|nr:MAG: nucleotide exchange factor GrpE [Candidatus Uhrbacteria bacterium RIFCSPHIGHO2_02_FULL_57_19]